MHKGVNYYVCFFCFSLASSERIHSLYYIRIHKHERKITKIKKKILVLHEMHKGVNYYVCFFCFSLASSERCIKIHCFKTNASNVKL